jgi:hypothetical protein
MVNQTLISRRSQIELKRKFFLLKDVLVVRFGQHFCQVGDYQCFIHGISQDLSPNHLGFWFCDLLLNHCHHSFHLDCICHWS